MLRSVRQLIGYRLAATDGELGRAEDFYFDDRRWTVRYLVVSLEKSPFGREVLISPASVKEPDQDRRVIPVSLTVRQVEQSPDVETDLPVSGQREARLAEHYDWAFRWQGFGVSVAPIPAIGKAVRVGLEKDLPSGDGDPHLRSVVEVATYAIGAYNSDIGRVQDFIAHTDDWTIRYIVVKTRTWLSRRKVLVSPVWLDRLDWGEKRIYVGLSCEEIKGRPLFDASAPVERDYEGQLYDYHRRPKCR
jgi:hypothetical protein